MEFMTGKALKQKINDRRQWYTNDAEFNNLKIRVFAGLYTYMILTDGKSDIHTIELYGKHTPKTW